MNVSWAMYAKLSLLFLVLAGAAGFNFAVWGLRREPQQLAWQVPASDPERGRSLVQKYGCVGCHTIPRVPNATGKVGPRLDRFQERVYIAGVIPNSGQNLTYWIQHPQKVSPESAMPDLRVTEQDARDIASFLYSLR
jgi:cytochrome c1